MTDSFADLWASTAPTKSTEQQQRKLESTKQYDAFSILSASQPPSTTTRAPPKPAFVDRQLRQHHSGGRDADAFSTLFSSSLNDIAATANMTMAERAAALANKGKAAAPARGASPAPPGLSPASLWDGLDALTRPTTASPHPPLPASARNVPVANLSRPATASPHSGASVEQDNDDWGMSEFASPPRSGSSPAKPTSTTSQPTNIWDLDEFATAEPPRTLPSQPLSQPPPRSLTETPGDFDFGDREDRLLGGVDSDEEDTFGIRGGHSADDILGNLGKPVSHSHSPSPNPPTSSHAPSRLQCTTVSPPPHIIGQLVEMGFSPSDARAALANTTTDNSFDVQAATELLLSQNDQEESLQDPSHPPESKRRNRERNGDRETRRPPPPTRNDIHAEPPNFTSTSGPSQSQIDATTEKLLSQASELGRGMFSKANALWKEGKERAVKMYEERAAAANTASGTTISDGRPRWMRDRDRPGEEPRRPGPAGGHDSIRATVFKDDEVEEVETKQRPHARRPYQSQALPEREREVDLFAVDSPTTTYQSPYRRGKPKSQAPSLSMQSSSPAVVLLPQTAGSASIHLSTESPPPPRTLTTTIALSALVSSTSHKSAGTDAYKRGDFPVALAAYTRALSALPPEDVLRVPILTNVALVRTKVGELKEAVQACEQAIVIVGRFVGGANGERNGQVSFMESVSGFDEKAPAPQVGTGKVSVSTQDGDATSNKDLPTCVDLIEGLSKAFKRRAEALEGLEKWEKARRTWEILLGAEWAGSGVKNEAAKGVSRCRKMVGGGGDGAGDPSATFRPAPARTRPKLKHGSSSTSSGSSRSHSAAVTALRSTNDAQQTEDAARLVCKDSVDARLSVWKAGREGNIRALLTSLDESVLWPELGWRKVGMAEVVSKGQVKGAYMRAIARVHPDKLNAGNTTVEQRMIANGVFGALNEAWTVFQQQ